MAMKDTAPNMSKLSITKKQVTSRLLKSATVSEPIPEPEVTKEKVLALMDIVYGPGGIAKAGGLVQVASDIGLSINQVKLYMKEFKALEAEYN